MFRHKQKMVPSKEEDKKVDKKVDLNIEKTDQAVETPVLTKEAVDKDTSPAGLRDLLEKNLKWSQIIYEQNRKINRRLTWIVVGAWLRVAVIVAPIILAVIFLPPYLREFWQNYGQLFGSTLSTVGSVKNVTQPNNTVDQLLKLLPIDSAKQEQIKQILK